MKKTLSLLALAAFAAATVHAAPPVARDLAKSYGIDVGRSDWWYSLGGSSYPDSNWRDEDPELWGTLQSQARLNASDPAASIVKLADLGGGIGNGPITSGQSIYFLGAGTLGVVADNPLAGVRTVFLQLSMGEYYGQSFLDGVMPQLQIRVSGEADPILIDLQPGFHGRLEAVDDGTFNTPDGPKPNFLNLWGFQWDLPALYTNISEIAVSFSALPHVALYQVQLDQSSTFYSDSVFTFIPEPATYALILGAGVLGLIAVRRRRRR